MLTLRPVFLTTLAFSLLAVASASGCSNKSETTQEDAAELQAVVEELKAKKRASAEDQGAQGAQDSLVTTVERMRDVAAKQNGPLAGYLQIVTDVSKRLVAPVAGAHTAAMAKFNAAGSIDPATLDTKHKLAERKKLVAAACKASEAYLAADGQLVAEIEKAIRSGPDGNSKDARDFLAGFRNAQTGSGHQILQESTNACYAMQTIVDILAAEFGHWNNTEEALEFESDAAIEKYGKAMAKLESSVAAIEALEAKQLAAKQ